MPDDAIIKPGEERLWAPMWQEEFLNYDRLLPYEKEVWSVVHDSWRVNISETFGQKWPIAYVGTDKNPYLLFPSYVAYHAGIGEPDKLTRETPGKEFMKALTQIRIPILFLHRQFELEVLRWILSTVSGPIPIKGVARSMFELATQKRLTFFVPEIYADADTASKYMTIMHFLVEWEDDIGHKVNPYTSKIVCFHADPAVKEKLRAEFKLWGLVEPGYTEPIVWEFNPGKDYYKIRERYGRTVPEE